MIDTRLSEAVVAFVGWDTQVAIPGRHPDRIADAALRTQVQEIVDFADRRPPGHGGLQEWGRALAKSLATEFPELSARAVDAVVALQTYEWR